MKNSKSNHNNNYPIIDERQKKVVGDISSFILLITIIYLLVEIAYKYTTTKDILTTSWEIVLIILISIIYTVGMSLKKEIDLPKSFLGKKLPTGNSKKIKRIRIKSYLLKSIFFSTAITAITLFFTFTGVEKKLRVIEYISEFLGLILIYFLLSYIISEYNIKKYNKYMKSLDN